MNRIAQEAAFRLAVVRYAERHGPSQAAIKYRVSRMTVYRWRKRYDGTKESLVPRSRRPHHHPNQHTKAEDALIRNMRRRRPHGWSCFGSGCGCEAAHAPSQGCTGICGA